jgi:TolB protein
MAFVSKNNGNTEIFVAGSEGQNPRAISNHPAADEHPSWFPDNQHLAFASNRNEGWQIYRMDTNGGNQLRLTYSGNDNRYLDVSPYGDQIAYVALGDSYPIIHLMLMDSDGGNARSLLTYSSRKQRDNTGSFIYRPDWAPDGRYIAFGADHDADGIISIIVIDTITGEDRVLIRDGNGPAWSPNGEQLIYKPAGEKQILFVADNQGSPLYQLTGSHYATWSPDWGPR